MTTNGVKNLRLSPMTGDGKSELGRSKSLIDQLDTFHASRAGYAVFAALELGLTYLFISWAIDSGNLFDYLFTLIFFVGFLQNFVKLIRSFIRGNNKQH